MNKPKLDEKQLPRVRELFMLMPKLPVKDHGFANSLQDSFRKYGHLTTAQMEWIERLIHRATAPKPLGEGPERSEARQHTQHIPGFASVEDLLYRARQHIQFPAIRLRTTKGQDLILRPREKERAVKVSLARSNQMGGSTRGIVRNEILDTSELRFLPDLTDILNTLYELASNPVQTAILHGKKTGNCCFCGLTLTDLRSIEMGYGPICAENYGLPWGELKTGKVTADEMGALLDAQK